MIEFKSEREYLEWNSPRLDRRAKFVIYAIAGFVKEKFDKFLTVTGIYRTQEEQDDTYKDNPEYKIQPWKSVHQVWRGIDLRSTTFTPEEIEQLKEYINKIVFYDKLHSTLIWHDVGEGIHLHVQVNHDDFTMLVTEGL